MSSDGLVLVKAVALGIAATFVFSLFVWMTMIAFKPAQQEPKTYQIACIIWTPSGPIATIQTEATNAKITSFGVIKSDEGLYVPAANELCMVKEIKQ